MVGGGVEVDTAVEVVAAEVIEPGADGGAALGAVVVVVAGEVNETWEGAEVTKVCAGEVTGVQSAELDIIFCANVGGEVFEGDVISDEEVPGVGAADAGVAVLDVTVDSVLADAIARDMASVAVVNIAAAGRSGCCMEVEDDRGGEIESPATESRPDPVKPVSEFIPWCVTRIAPSPNVSLVLPSLHAPAKNSGSPHRASPLMLVGVASCPFDNEPDMGLSRNTGMEAMLQDGIGLDWFMSVLSLTEALTLVTPLSYLKYEFQSGGGDGVAGGVGCGVGFTTTTVGKGKGRGAARMVGDALADAGDDVH